MKKGLLIKPVLMMMLLLVSLSTATFAWFTVGTTASVEGMDMTAAASGSLIITNGKYDSSSNNFFGASYEASASFVNITSWVGSETSYDYDGNFWAIDEAAGRDEYGQPQGYLAATVDTQYIEQTFSVYQETSTAQTIEVYLATTEFTTTTGTLDDAYRVSIELIEYSDTSLTASNTNATAGPVVFANSESKSEVITDADGTGVEKTSESLADLVATTATQSAAKATEGYVGSFNTIGSGSVYYGYLTFTVRIWLEGTDGNCVDAQLTAATDAVSLDLDFMSFSV